MGEYWRRDAGKKPCDWRSLAKALLAKPIEWPAIPHPNEAELKEPGKLAYVYRHSLQTLLPPVADIYTPAETSPRYQATMEGLMTYRCGIMEEKLHALTQTNPELAKEVTAFLDSYLNDIRTQRVEDMSFAMLRDGVARLNPTKKAQAKFLNATDELDDEAEAFFSTYEELIERVADEAPSQWKPMVKAFSALAAMHVIQQKLPVEVTLIREADKHADGQGLEMEFNFLKSDWKDISNASNMLSHALKSEQKEQLAQGEAEQSIEMQRATMHQKLYLACIEQLQNDVANVLDAYDNRAQGHRR